MDSLPQASSTPRTQISKGKEPRQLQKRKQAGNKESQPLESRRSFCNPLSTTYVLGWQTWAGEGQWPEGQSLGDAPGKWSQQKVVHGERTVFPHCPFHLPSVLANTSKAPWCPLYLPGRTHAGMDYLRCSFLWDTTVPSPVCLGHWV